VALSQQQRGFRVADGQLHRQRGQHHRRRHDHDPSTIADESGSVRLYGIDCPERRQPYATVARKFAGDLAFGKTVAVRVRDVDRYGRVVGEVIR